MKLLKGLGYNPPEPLDIEQVKHELSNGSKLYLLSSTGINLEEEGSRSRPELAAEIDRLLEEFRGVTDATNKLPPTREFDHQIHLMDESKPVNVAPYRYAHFQKNEIEKQVQEMMGGGLIRYSTSPFSSPVLLVKKKDKTWRFCTDYRALNEVTIKDRFPIPTVEDMLDELH